MSEKSGRFSLVLALSRIALLVSILTLALAVVAGVGAAATILMDPVTWASWLGAGAMPPRAFAVLCIAVCSLEVMGAVSLGLWLWTLQGIVRVRISEEDSRRTIAGRIRTVETLLEDQAAAAHRMVDLASLSEQARSLLYRDREVEAFRETVQADLTRQDYVAAAEHIEAIEKRFGYAEEAARLRREVEESRRAGAEEKLDQAIRRLGVIMDRHDWARAQREAQRIMQTFPDNPKVASLPQRIEEARLQTKRSLLKEYKEAVDKKDVETGVRLLKELDRYLTPQEAAAWAESARGVFHAKLLNLGVQFSIHVADQRWDQALATGEEITREFPNTRMAQEVREKLDLLRQRAAQQPAQK
jgi:hypothetical protein